MIAIGPKMKKKNNIILRIPTTIPIFPYFPPLADDTGEDDGSPEVAFSC